MSILAPPFTGDPPLPTDRLPPDREIGSLWCRVIAFAIDGLVVGLAAIVMALPFFESFSRLGPWGRLVGFCFALPYFGILNSSIGNGRTLGKRLMHLQVIDKHGATISFWKSIARYGVFAVPFYLNNMLLPTSRTPRAVFILTSLLIFGVGGATVYLVIFNRHTRQGIHDLIVGSYVGDADRAGSLKLKPTWRIHWLILGSLLIAFSLGTGILDSKVEKSEPFPRLLEDVRLIEGMGGVQVAGAQDLVWTNWSDGNKKTILVINVYWTGKTSDEQAFADRVARLIVEHDSKVKEHDLLRVVMIRGYDLGIAHARVSHPYEHTPADWSVRLSGAPKV